MTLASTNTFPIYANHAFTTYVISAEFGVIYLYPIADWPYRLSDRRRWSAVLSPDLGTLGIFLANPVVQTGNPYLPCESRNEVVTHGPAVQSTATVFHPAHCPSRLELFVHI